MSLLSEIQSMSPKELAQLKTLLNGVQTMDPGKPNKPVKELPYWKPNKNDIVYIITTQGVTQVHWDPEDKALRKLYSAGLLVETKAEGDYEFNHRYIRERVKRYARACKTQPDFDNLKHVKYAIGYNAQTKEVCVKSTKYGYTEAIYFNNALDVERVINLIGADNILNYYFDVCPIK